VLIASGVKTQAAAKPKSQIPNPKSKRYA